MQRLEPMSSARRPYADFPKAGVVRGDRCWSVWRLCEVYPSPRKDSSIALARGGACLVFPIGMLLLLVSEFGALVEFIEPS